MSSLIPKISIGVDTKKSHFDLSSMTHTTSEIGYVSPTFGREIVPNSKVKINTRTGCRLSPLFVPTMGRLDVRHYHCFVPYSTLYFPFDAFITGTNYTFPDSTTFVPQNLPYFSVGDLLKSIFSFNTTYESGYQPFEDLTATIVKETTVAGVTSHDVLTDAEIVALNSASEGYAVYDIVNNLSLFMRPGIVVSKEGNFYTFTKVGQKWQLAPYSVLNPSKLKAEKSFPSQFAFDFNDNTYYEDSENSNAKVYFSINYNWNGALKRLRTIFLALGYCFNPYDNVDVTPLKLFALYKSYWQLFGVNRDFNFFNTNCYKLIKYLSDNSISGSFLNAVSYPTAFGLFMNFVRNDLTSLTYTCPVDYFSASDTMTGRGAVNGYGFSSAIAGDNGLGFEQSTTGATAGGASVATSGQYGEMTGANSPLAQKIAMRLLRFVNKNSVVGRKVSDILRSRYGVTDSHIMDHEGVYRIGASATKIEIAAIYNNTDTEDLPLGAYAGAGMSDRDSAVSKAFTFETKEFGVLLTLTAVVPKMGYFQGMLKENSCGVHDRFEMYTPEFDAIGWQAVNYNELVADRMVKDRLSSSSTIGTSLGIFGYMPTYSHLKVPFNRVLADISLPHMKDNMLAYTLDRYFKPYEFQTDGSPVPTTLPQNDPQTFRSGTQGDTNRIFTDMAPTDDHVIMQIYFDVKMTAPMKSIATSFDTFDEESTHSVDVAHE